MSLQLFLKNSYVLYYLEILLLTRVACRILDNLPLVVPIRSLLDDHDAPTSYQLGVHVGIKGQYAGVS